MLVRVTELAALACFLHIITHHSVLSAGENDPKVDEALKILQHLSETRKGLTALKKVVTEIDGDLSETQKRTCLVGGGMSGHCAAAFVDNGMNMQNWLSGGSSPGKKRALPDVTALSPEMKNKLQRELDDLNRKRKGLEILSRILNEMEADLMKEQKRTCNFNLGGHCATESAAYVADHWHYLNSALSPGRKRRDTGLYKKLIAGKLFN